MAQGDTISGFASISAGQSLEIKPPSGEEWLIRNIYLETAVTTNQNVDLNIKNGSSSLYFHREVVSATVGGVYPPTASLTGLTIHLTASQFLRIANSAAGGSFSVMYDGIKTK